MIDQTAATIVDPTADATWLVEWFPPFWANPDLNAFPITADVVGRWPGGKVLRGFEEYRGHLVKIATLIPDLRLDLLESAVNGDLAFIRWRGHGTGPNGPVELFGVDRSRVKGDKIIENIVHLDTAAFASSVGVALSDI